MVTSNDRPPVSNRFALTLLLTFLAVAAISGAQPENRADWALENVLTLLALPALYWAHKKQWFSRRAYLMVFVFLLFHELGAHYTYSEVPYERWWHSLTGSSLSSALGWERNHYDRLIHLLFGILLLIPIREILQSTTRLSNAWSYAIAISIITTASTIYELIEWGASVVFGGDLGMAYLGTQGDIWDAHKDMALAMLGAVVTAGVLICIPRAKSKV